MKNAKLIKIVAIVTVVIMLVAAAVTLAAANSISSFKPGDLDGDGKVNGRDVRLIMRYTVGWRDDGINYDAADYNEDGKVNAKDILSLMLSIVNGEQQDESDKPPLDSYELPFIPC